MRITKLVVSFNRHFFAIALLACAVGVSVMVFVANPLVRTGLSLGVGLAAYFMIASVIAAYYNRRPYERAIKQICRMDRSAGEVDDGILMVLSTRRWLSA